MGGMGDLVSIEIQTNMELLSRNTPGAIVQEKDSGYWNLSIPAGEAGHYRWAQLDDYQHRLRKDFVWQAPIRFTMIARVSNPNLPGTWGFGLWNDPFSANLGLGGMARRLPVLPNAAWFFHASPPNYLSFRDDHPALGFLASSFTSPLIAPFLQVMAYPFLPLLAWKASARLVRRFLSRMIGESAVGLNVDVTSWHTYEIEWLPNRIDFRIDKRVCAVTSLSPRGKMGVVIWIDNQYAAFPPDGRIRFGTLTNPVQWLEVKDFDIKPI